MAHWEFLIQQDGDRSWLPLDTPDVEILEGRYRVVARSSQTNAAVDIRIVHEALYETPPRRRAQTRSAQTNFDGLMMVIPFTQLQPGTWELRCTSDVMSDMLGDGWQATVSLHVLPHEAQATDDWDTDWTPGVDEQSERATRSVSEASSKTLVEQHEPQAIANAAMDQVAAEGEPAFEAEPSVPQSSGVDPSAAAIAIASNLDSDLDSDSAETAIDSPSAADLGEYVQAVDDLIDAVFQQLDESLAEPLPSSTDSAAIVDAMESVTVGEPSEAIEAVESTKPVEPTALEESLDAIASDSSTASPVETTAADRAAEAAQGKADRSAAANSSLDSHVSHASEAIAPSHPIRPAPTDEDFAPSPVKPLRALPLTIQLSADTYTVPRTGGLTIGGTLALAAIAPEMSSKGANWAENYQLRIRLVDPQTGRSRQEVIEPLVNITPQQLPLSFQYDIAPNLDLNTHLLLGDVELFCGAMADHAAIAVQSFSVTVDVAELLSAIAQEPEASELFQAPLEFQDAKPAPAPDLTFLNFLSRPPQPVAMNASVQRTAAELAVQPTSSRSAASPDNIDLPNFDTPSPAAPSPTEATRLADSRSGAVSPVESSAAEALASSEPVSDRADDWIDETAEAAQDGWAIAEATPIASPPIDPLDSSRIQPPPIAVEDEDFQSLRLGDRFLTRLSSLANDRELTQWLSAVAPPPQSAQDATDNDLYGVTSPWQTAPSGWDADIASDEIVVDDNRRSGYGSQRSPASMLPIEPPSTFCISADQPIPTPTLVIPAPELTAGQPTHLRVLLPNVAAKIYVKVWIHDCQQRMVVDGPHWVSNFLPNSQDQLEGSLLLTVPLGCMEARIEAIAIEILTQRESRKVSINRLVMPPDLPDMADGLVDELDICSAVPVNGVVLY